MVMKKKRMRTVDSRKMTIQRLKNLRLMTQRIIQKQKSETPRNSWPPFLKEFGTCRLMKSRSRQNPLADVQITYKTRSRSFMNEK